MRYVMLMFVLAVSACGGCLTEESAAADACGDRISGGGTGIGDVQAPSAVFHPNPVVLDADGAGSFTAFDVGKGCLVISGEASGGDLQLEPVSAPTRPSSSR